MIACTVAEASPRTQGHSASRAYVTVTTRAVPLNGTVYVVVQMMSLGKEPLAAELRTKKKGSVTRPLALQNSNV